MSFYNTETGTAKKRYGPGDRPAPERMVIALKDTVGIIFAYGSNTNLEGLTKHRPASSVPFGGRYRIIDFMLSNMVNAGITDIGVVLHERYQSLLDHLGAGKDWDISRKREGLRLLPPFGYGNKKAAGFRGQLDALYGVSEYIKRTRHKYVMLSGGDLIANLDLNQLARMHSDKGADITTYCAPGVMTACGQGVYVKTNRNRQVMQVRTGDYEPGECELTGIYFMQTKLLLDLITQCTAQNIFTLEQCIEKMLPGGLKVFAAGFDGYIARPCSSREYYMRSMELLKTGVRRDVFNTDRPVRTKVRDETSTYYGPDSRVRNSLIADGCYIEGTVENSILFRAVRVDRGAVLKDCIIMQDCTIYSGAELRCVIADKDVKISSGKQLIGQKNDPLTLSKGVAI